MIPFQNPKQDWRLPWSKQTNKILIFMISDAYFAFPRKLSWTDLYLFFADWNRYTIWVPFYSPFHLPTFKETWVGSLARINPFCIFAEYATWLFLPTYPGILQNKKNKGRRMKREKQKSIYVVSYFLFPLGLISKY